MESIDDGVQPDNPVINSVTTPLEIQTDTTGSAILFNIDHSGSVLYYVTVELGTITSPAPGVWNTHDPAAGDLEISYDASSEEAVDTITLKVKDPLGGNTVALAAPIRVVSRRAGSNITVLFGPVITGMEFIRTPEELKIAVELDSGLDPTYDWEINGNFDNLLNPYGSQTVISPFSNGDNGSVKVTVTDGNGIQASLTHYIMDGDFPYIGHKLVELQEFQNIPTTGSYDWEYFTIAGESYLAVANYSSGSTYNIDSIIYKWNGSSFVQFQAIPTSAGIDWEYFTIAGESYLAVANYLDGSTGNIDSIIYKWNGSSFVQFQAIPTNSAVDWEYFTIAGESYLVVANHSDGSSYNINSIIYKWNGSSFEQFQTVPTSGAWDWEYFSIAEESYLAVTNYYNGSTHNLDSVIYKWDGSSFVQFQALPSNNTTECEYFSIGGESYLALTNYYNGSADNDSVIYKWHVDSFVQFQVFSTNSNDWEYFSIGGESYLALANQYDSSGSTYNTDSIIYKWGGSSFYEIQNLSTSGANSLEYFSIGGESYLAVANLKNDSTYNIDSVVYKAVLNDYNALLLHMDGEGQNFHSSTNNPPYVEAFGDADQSMDYPAKFGKSARFDGDNDYLSVGFHPDFLFGADRFTIDFWIYPADSSMDCGLFTLDINYDKFLGISISQNDIQLGINGSWSGSDSDVFGAAGQWYHLAVLRESDDTVKAYVNGTLVHTVNGLTGVNITSSGSPLYIGRGADVDPLVTNYFNGYIDEFRISKGVARWLSDFTPPTAPY